jgi:hypothetical protein
MIYDNTLYSGLSQYEDSKKYLSLTTKDVPWNLWVYVGQVRMSHCGAEKIMVQFGSTDFNLKLGNTLNGVSYFYSSWVETTKIEC